MQYILQIDGLPTGARFNAMPFGRQMEYRREIEAFKASAKSIHFRAKGKPTRTAFSEFKRLYRPSQWFAVNRDAHMYHDDSFQVWYTEASEVSA